MLVKDYTESCLQFAEDSKEWAEINSYNFYTTSGNGWEETCDNAHCGIDVSWAFHKNTEQIREKAPQKFVDAIAQLVELAIDDEWDGEQMQFILDVMKK